MNDLIPHTRVEGNVTLDGKNIYSPETDVVLLRQRVAWFFQRPNPFPKSILENVNLLVPTSALGFVRSRTLEERAGAESQGSWPLVRGLRPAFTVVPWVSPWGQQQRLCDGQGSGCPVRGYFDGMNRAQPLIPWLH